MDKLCLHKLCRNKHFSTAGTISPYPGGGGHLGVNNEGGGAGSIVWGLGFWFGKDILGFFKT